MVLITAGVYLGVEMYQFSCACNILFVVIVYSSDYFRDRGIVSVVCLFVLSKGIKPFVSDLMRAAT